MTHSESTAETTQPLLLHICCGPCATAVIERIAQSFAVTGYFYNPNIYPEEEYLRRCDAAFAVTRQLSVPFVEGPRDPALFDDAVRGFEREPENGARCDRCYRMRLAGTADVAAAEGFAAMASTLTIGPRKPAGIINPIGEAVAGEAGIDFLAEDWKKRDGFKRSCELARDLQLYRQHYCGCRYSMPDGG